MGNYLASSLYLLKMKHRLNVQLPIFSEAYVYPLNNTYMYLFNAVKIIWSRGGVGVLKTMQYKYLIANNIAVDTKEITN